MITHPAVTRHLVQLFDFWYLINMLSIKYIRENYEEVKAGLERKNFQVDLQELLGLEEQVRALKTETDNLRSVQNAANKDIANAAPEEKQEKIAKMQAVSSELKQKLSKMDEDQEKLMAILADIPNPAHESVPVGETEADSVVIKNVGEPKKFDFEPKDHVSLGQALNILDVERAAKVSGSRFVFLKNELVLLEYALVQYALNKLVSKGFQPVIPPVLVKEEAMFGTGFLPADESQIYKTEKDDLYLVGTSEVPLASYHANEIIDEDKLPLRYAGISTCFRREAGAYGKDMGGMFRVHQFDKIEMYSYSTPEKSWEEHEYIRSIEEEFMQDMGFAYHVVNICGADLGASAAKKYDIDVYLPGQDTYRELTSTSNTTDFQARRLNIRVRTKEGNKILHTLNGTAIAIGRMLIAIMENYQQSDGSIKVPEVLQKYVGFEKIG